MGVGGPKTSIWRPRMARSIGSPSGLPASSAVIAIFDRVDEALASLASGEPEPSPTEKRAS